MTGKFLLVTTVTFGSAVASLAVGYSRYTHPEVISRTTLDLQREVMSLNANQSEEPFFVRIPRIQRQKVIAAELSGRFAKQITTWQAEEAAEEQRVD